MNGLSTALRGELPVCRLVTRPPSSLTMGFIVQVGVGIAAMGELDVSSCAVAAGVGQVVTLMWLINALLSSPKKRIEVD